MLVRFYRLARKPQTGRGRRFYRLVSYPCDQGEFENLQIAQNRARSRLYAALYASEGKQWIILDEAARQCVAWHNGGRGDYVVTY